MGATQISGNEVEAAGIPFGDIQDIATNKLLGRATGGSGDIEEITLGTNLSFTGTTLNAAGGGSIDYTQVLFMQIFS